MVLEAVRQEVGDETEVEQRQQAAPCVNRGRLGGERRDQQDDDQELEARDAQSARLNLVLNQIQEGADVLSFPFQAGDLRSRKADAELLLDGDDEVDVHQRVPIPRRARPRFRARP